MFSTETSLGESPSRGLLRDYESSDGTFSSTTEDAATPLNYYAALRPVAELLGPDTYVVSEGANTMDIGRTMLPNLKPRHRSAADCKRCQ